jgi:hypothetical protein
VAVFRDSFFTLHLLNGGLMSAGSVPGMVLTVQAVYSGPFSSGLGGWRTRMNIQRWGLKSGRIQRGGVKRPLVSCKDFQGRISLDSHLCALKTPTSERTGHTAIA